MAGLFLYQSNFLDFSWVTDNTYHIGKVEVEQIMHVGI